MLVRVWRFSTRSEAPIFLAASRIASMPAGLRDGLTGNQPTTGVLNRVHWIARAAERRMPARSFHFQ